MSRRKNIVFRILFTASTVLLLAFIFVQSLMSADQSSSESGTVGKWIKALLDWIGLSAGSEIFTENLLRKCAHYTEFFMLGASAFLMYRSYRPAIRRAAAAATVTGAAAAVTDELIQLSSQGRSCEFRDMLIDTAGALTAALLLLLIFWIKNRKKKEHEKNR